jgi:hypothetical protein
MTQDPNAIQHGGDHYRASAYLTRIKDPELDPKKAVHFLDKLIHLVNNDKLPSAFYPTMRYAMPTPEEAEDYFSAYFAANSIEPDSLRAQGIREIARVRTMRDLRQARETTARFAGMESES